MNYQVKKLVYLALLTALATVLMFFEVPLIPTATFLTLDFSFIPLLMIVLIFGQRWVIVSAIIVNLFHFVFKGSPVGWPVGELANVIALFTYLSIFAFWQSHKKIAIGCITAVIGVTIAMIIANYYVISPLFFKALGVDYRLLHLDIWGFSLSEDFLLFCVQLYGAFNLIRWSIISLTNYVINKWLVKFSERIKNSVQIAS